MDQFRWIDPTQPGRLVQGTQMLYISAFFDVFNAVIIGGAFSLVFLVLGITKAGGAWGIANEKKIGYQVACAAAVATVVFDLLLLSGSPVFGLIGLAISVWIVTLVLHDSSRGYARIWFK